MHTDSFDRAGRPISDEERRRLRADGSYARVGIDIVGDQKISTVWLGINLLLTAGQPLIFETLVSRAGDPDEVEIERSLYHTEAEAKQGHKDAVARARQKYMTSGNGGSH